MNKFLKSLSRLLWSILSVTFALLLTVSIVGDVIADENKRTINDFLGLENYRKEVNEDAELLHYSSEFEKEDGSYDDKALWEEDIRVADRIQREGTTILWNNDAAGHTGLPLTKGTTVSLFSHSSVDFVYSGMGSGNSITKNSSNLKQAFTNAGLPVNDTLWQFYSKGEGSGDKYVRNAYSGVNEVPWSLVKSNCETSFDGTVGVFVLSRRAGENGETDSTMKTADTLNKDYFELAKNEKDTIEGMVGLKKDGVLSKVIVMLNTAMGINFRYLEEYRDDIDCCIWVCQPGWEGINEIGRIFSGDSVPSGHLVDTFAYDHQSAPAAVNADFSTYTNSNDAGLRDLQFQANYMIYAEDIYVGYKYYETRYEDAVMGNGNATSKTGAKNSSGDWKYSEEVAFPFGHGESYTSFEYDAFSVEQQEDGSYLASVTVKNVGNQPGEDAVQIYSQKPYTAYDKQHGIEQAAVNLCGYERTEMLYPESQTDETHPNSQRVKIVIPADVFKTYDADGYKTYILEEGDFYLTAAEDAHQAVNNILARKGYSPASTGNVMDGAGKSSLVWLWNNKTTDATMFSRSSTGYAITNQFDDTDWNKYKNKTDGTVVYLSRSDWAGTWPKPLALSLSDAMVADLDWDKPVTADPKDKMPLYGQAHEFDIIDLRGKDYNDAAWDTLLNQTTLEEQIQFLGKAYHGTPAINSITYMGERCLDGPLGVRQKYLTDDDASPADNQNMSFPCTPLLSASFSKKLALRAGQLKGEDMLHTGVAGLYGTGVNLHRTIWGGRAYEYYSEDGYLSGIMCAQEVKGIQEKGGYVNLKHFALNDQEANRHGVNIWCNEQAIREVYLLAFQPVVEDAHATGMMSSFTRFGTTWSGAHYGLTTEVLRNEWGFDGFVISDCAWRNYMGVVDGLVGGNDNILYESTNLAAYYEAQTNATVAQLIRRSTHRVLYVLANSSAMEGYTPGMHIFPVTNWWQHAIIAMIVVFGILTAGSVTMLVLSCVLKKRRRDVLIQEGKMNEKGQRLNKKGEVVNSAVRYSIVGVSLGAVVLAIVLVIVLVILPLVQSIFAGEDYESKPGTNQGATHTCSHVCDFCGACRDANCEDPVCAKKCPGHLVDNLPADYAIYSFEAECAKLETNAPGTCNATNGGNPSGGLFIQNMSKVSSAKLTFEITSDSAQDAVLILRMGHRESEYAWSDMFTLTLNGEAVEGIEYTFPVMRAGSVKYFDWQDNEICVLKLKEGNNTIVLSKVTYGLNFDTLKLASSAELEWTSEAGKDEATKHSFGKWEVITEPTLEKGGVLGSYCTTCRAYKESKIPAISEDTGYHKVVKKEATATSFGESSWEYEFEGNKFSFDSLIYPTQGETKMQRFECEDMIVTGDAHSAREGGSNNPSGGYYIGGISGKDYSLTLTVESDMETEAIFYIGFGCRNDRSLTFNGICKLTVNGKAVSVSDNVVFRQADSSFNYFNWESVMVVTIKLQKGTNTIVVEDNSKATSSNMDYFELLTNATLTVPEDEIT